MSTTVCSEVKVLAGDLNTGNKMYTAQSKYPRVGWREQTSCRCYQDAHPEQDHAAEEMEGFQTTGCSDDKTVKMLDESD